MLGGKDIDMNEVMDQIHAAHIVIIKEIERICKKHNIRYFIESGTLLGAIRHKSAIPWDDDADTAMLRSDFEKFRRVDRDELQEGFAYIEPKDLGNNAIFDFVPRVVMLNSQVHKDSEEERFYGDGMNNHIVVDIFIIDDMHDNDFIHKLTHAALVAVYGMAMGHRYRLDMEKYHGASKIIVQLLSTIGKLFSAETILKWHDKLAVSGRNKNKKKHRCYYSNFLIQDIKLVYDKRWFAKDTQVPLDGQWFPAPKEWDLVLKTIYGDYMQLPPEEERVISHCDLEHVKIWETGK